MFTYYRYIFYWAPHILGGVREFRVRIKLRVKVRVRE